MRIVFMGTPQFAVTSLDELLMAGCDIVGVVTAPDKPAGRGQKVSQSAVKEYAVAHGLKVMQPEKLKDQAFLDELKALQAELFVVVAFRMLPEDSLDNAHTRHGKSARITVAAVSRGRPY